VDAGKGFSGMATTARIAVDLAAERASRWKVLISRSVREKVQLAG
jgi:hypothetical protein